MFAYPITNNNEKQTVFYSVKRLYEKGIVDCKKV